MVAKQDFSRRVFSSQQIAHQRRFRAASHYAREAAMREPVYAALAAGTLTTAYNIALSDWFHPPVIHAIEIKGSRIRVSASDNVRVARLRVTLLALDGDVLEQGEAVRATGSWWRYIPSAPLTPGRRIQAQAWDLAGNIASLEKKI